MEATVLHKPSKSAKVDQLAVVHKTAIFSSRTGQFECRVFYVQSNNSLRDVIFVTDNPI